METPVLVELVFSLLRTNEGEYYVIWKSIRAIARVNASLHLLCRPTSSPPSPPRLRFPPTGLILSYCSDRLPWHSRLFSPAFRRGLVCLPPHCVRFAHNLSSFPPSLPDVCFNVFVYFSGKNRRHFACLLLTYGNLWCFLGTLVITWAARAATYVCGRSASDAIRHIVWGMFAFSHQKLQRPVLLVSLYIQLIIIIMEICKAPTLRLKALNKHIHIMYIEMENVIHFF